MPQGLEIHIESPKSGTGFLYYGKFTHSLKMPWGAWDLTSEPKILFEVGNITVFECWASESVEDDQGYVAESTIAYNPLSRHFIVGRKTDGETVWWHNLIAEYDLKNMRFVESSVTLEEKRVIVKGYGGYGDEQGKTVCIDVETGVKSVMQVL